MASVSAIAVQPRALVVDGAGAVTATVDIVRAPDDQGGPVSIEVRNLPDGATADALTLGPGETHGTLRINAAGAVRTLAPLSVVAIPVGAPTSTAYAVLATGGITSGVLDTTFGVDGISTDYLVPRWSRQTDGSLLVENDPEILRLAPDGTETGYRTAAIPLDTLRVVRTLPDGSLIGAGYQRILTSGWAQLQGTIWKLDANGALDLGFGSGGVATPENAREILDVIPDASGNLVILGLVPSGNVFVARLTASGQPDASFNGGNIGINRLGSDGLEIDQTLPMADGGWLIAGGDKGAGVLARLTATGDLDQNFGTAGIRRLDAAHYLGISARDDGSFIALRAGVVDGDFDTNIDTFVEWFDPTGFLSSSWQYAALDDSAQSWSFDPQGRPVVAISGSTQALVVRLADGDVDPSFGDGGLMALSDYIGEAAPIDAVTTDAHGRIMVTNAGATMRILP
jgi:uncharacterized delta-60 repeat protein